MEMSLRTRRIRAAFTFSAVLALATPLNAQDFGAPDVIDQGLMLSGNSVVLTSHSGQTDNRDWMEFRTDPCGTLQNVETSRSLLKHSAFINEFDDPDDEDDPAVLGQEMIARWLAAHPELAVINEGIAKSCGDDSWLDDDEPPGNFEATLPRPSNAPGANSSTIA
jgi:hypothetical protein